MSIIHSKKHYVHLSNGSVASGAATTFDAVEAVVAPAVGDAQEVVEGSTIKAVHFELWVWGAGASGTDTQFTCAIEKVSAGQTPMTFTQSSNLGAYPNKKNIFWTSQGVIGGVDTQSIPIIRDWLLIPKGKQRFGLGDVLSVTITTLGASLQRCGLITYKEYS